MIFLNSEDMKNITNSLLWNEFIFSLVQTKDCAIARSRSSNLAIAITLRSFFEVKIGDHLAIAKKRSPLRSPIARSAIGHALEIDHCAEPALAHMALME